MNFYFLVPSLDEETHIELLLFSFVLLVMVLLLTVELTDLRVLLSGYQPT